MCACFNFVCLCTHKFVCDGTGGGGGVCVHVSVLVVGGGIMCGQV